MEGQAMSIQRLHLQGVNCKRVLPVLAFSVLLADQLSKLWVRESLPLNESTPQEAFLRISNVVNPGLLFGISSPIAVSIVLTAAAVVIPLFLYWRYAPVNSRLLAASMGLFIGGCMGTLVDRMVFGGVTDIIDVKVSDGFGRAVFNVADLCCIAGFIVFAVFLIRLRLVRIPKQQYLIPYIWRHVVESERKRSQNSWWWKPAFLRLRSQGTVLVRSSGTGSACPQTTPAYKPTGRSSSSPVTRSR
jgi:signal peptidase II